MDEDLFFISYCFHEKDEWEPDHYPIDRLQLLFHLRLVLPEYDPFAFAYLSLQKPGDSIHIVGKIATVFVYWLEP